LKARLFINSEQSRAGEAFAPPACAYRAACESLHADARRFQLHPAKWLSSGGTRPDARFSPILWGNPHIAALPRTGCDALDLIPTTALRERKNYGLRGWISTFSRSGPGTIKAAFQAVCRERIVLHYAVR
jgi:hypothetical protein